MLKWPFKDDCRDAQSNSHSKPLCVETKYYSRHLDSTSSHDIIVRGLNIEFETRDYPKTNVSDLFYNIVGAVGLWFGWSLFDTYRLLKLILKCTRHPLIRR